MKCPVCDYPMTALFTSYACDRCDGLVAGSSKFEGWVVWDVKETADTCLKYVFKYVDHAERWRDLNQMYDCDICLVVSDHPFGWYEGTGIIKGVTIADRLVKVAASAKSYKPGPCSALLIGRERIA